MNCYLLTTTKFIKECLLFQIYGSTNSNWLTNINMGDIVFISQFNYKSQNIYGPFIVTKRVFYDKKIIYPKQKYYYRIQFKPLRKNIYQIKETDLYLSGIKNKNISFASQLICLIQQNKHMHSIALTQEEQNFLIKTFIQFGIKINKLNKKYYPNKTLPEVNNIFIKNKNRLDIKKYFISENDLESYIIISLKNNENVKNYFNNILKIYPNNNIYKSKIYNQFIFHNTYPTDVVILNKDNINIFELKKGEIKMGMLETIIKEFEKYSYYSLTSHRLLSQKQIKRMNFYLLCLKIDKKIINILKNKFNTITKPINQYRENDLTFIQYSIINGELNLKIIE